MRLAACEPASCTGCTKMLSFEQNRPEPGGFWRPIWQRRRQPRLLLHRLRRPFLLSNSMGATFHAMAIQLRSKQESGTTHKSNAKKALATSRWASKDKKSDNSENLAVSKKSPPIYKPLTKEQYLELNHKQRRTHNSVRKSAEAKIGS